MQGVTNVGASILARQTKKAKIVILGNILPIWDDPLWLAEQLAMIDMISYGRLVSGFVRGGGRESVSHNAPPHYNRERFEEAHDFIVKTWTTAGPFRWEGKHYHYRYVNPWAKPLQQPHPQIWIPSTVSVETVKWTAQHRYPIVLLATKLEPTKEAFRLYADTATEAGYTSGTQHVAYLFKVHVDETEEKAEEVGRKFLSGVSNPFLAGNEGTVNPAIMNLPGHTSRTSRRLAAASFGPAGRFGINRRNYEDQVNDYTIISGTPKTVLPKIRHVLEYLRPGSIFFWDGDGAMTHEDQMRSLRLMGAEIIPAVREMGEELELFGPFEVDPANGQPMGARLASGTPLASHAAAGALPEINA
jgi:alkanesulfonate monooxygenase SsuD/methylene tetrahydromethanopterin reductase-like flavin-dependent oxidoreductase (luciferase family)